MKLNINRKKLRFGGVAIALTACIIAAVVLFNVFFYSIATNMSWYIDMTSEALFTLTDDCVNIIDKAINGEGGVNAQRAKYNELNKLNKGDEGYKEPAAVTIYFCDNTINLEDESSLMKYVYTTAKALDSKFDFIDIKYLDWEYNPSSVHKFQTTGSTINSQSIIVESGSEYRVHTLASMFMTNDSGEVWAYAGERMLSSSILGVTSAEQPIAFVTQNHSEAFFDNSLLRLIEMAGYRVVAEGSKFIDENGNEQVASLNNKDYNPLENPEVRLVVIYNPRSDFATEGVNELDRLNRYLENNNAMMVFMGPTSPVLSDFEGWLADKWGIVFDRYRGSDESIYSYMITDTTASLDAAGYAVKADYITSGGLGSKIYSSIIEKGITPPVYFENAMSISYASHFTKTHYGDAEDKSKDYTYGKFVGDGTDKEIYDVFNAPGTSVAIANGTTVAEGSSGSSTGAISYIFKDVDGKIYRINDARTEILDPNGEKIHMSQAGGYKTDYGTLINFDPETGRIYALDSSVGTENIMIVKEIIEYTGAKYKLSPDGKAIFDEGGKVIEVDGNGRFKTVAGSILEIESVYGEPSIKIVESAKNESDPFKFMTITSRNSSVSDSSYMTTSQNAYVLACGSLEFATSRYLESTVYGNSDVLLSAMTLMGRDSVPIGLSFKPFASFDISDITDAEANRYTLLLTLIPPVIILGVGIFVLVRRKYS